MKKKIDVYEHMGEILKGVKSGVLITGKADDKVNSMTISWGMVGIEWGKLKGRIMQMLRLQIDL